jgi:hypothetical protein
VDSSRFNNNVPNKLKEEEKENRRSKETEKKLERNHQENRYQYKNRHCHGKESFLNKTAKSTKLGTAVPKSTISLEPTTAALRHQSSPSTAGSTKVSISPRNISEQGAHIS